MGFSTECLFLRFYKEGGQRWGFFPQHRNSATWMLCVGAHSTIHDVEGLEFEGVFNSTVPGSFSTALWTG